MAAKRVNLSDVAKLSGVSITSASMALSNSPRVAEGTKVRVREAARSLGYVPHSAASSLRSQRVDAVAVVVPHETRHVFSHPYFIELIEGILGTANQRDINVILSTARTGSDESSAYSRIMRGRAAAGVIVAAASTTDGNLIDITRAGYPVVVVGRTPAHPAITTVGIDDIRGAQMATEHLIQVHGARRIGHISGPLNHQSAIDKREGYIRGVREAGLDINPRLQFEGDYTEESGARAAAQLMSELENCDALFFANDQMAVAAIDWLSRKGVDVPGDLGIIGYDNHPLSAHARPSVTTVGADMVQVGQRALELLLHQLNGDLDVQHVEFPTELVVRESCGCRSNPS
jgi:DNA-binding LacI/PurR family transcriptional regulator